MSSSRELKKFQSESAAFVLDKLKNRSTYAIADEVGLGKTRVVAEVGLQLVLQRPHENRQVIFYIAPSFELIDQNLKAIRRYLVDRCKELGVEMEIVSLISRLSKIDSDIVREAHSDKRHLFIVGLSPETSFRVRGKGSISEREVLAALLTYGKWNDYQTSVETYLWNLDREVPLSFRENISKLRSVKFLRNTDHYQKCEPIQRVVSDILAESDPRYSPNSRKIIRSKLGELRKAVVEQWLSQRQLCTLLILDEWHKYKQTCFQDSLLTQFIDKIRGHDRSKLLLVSATPFSVHFEDSEVGQGRRMHDDFKSLFELYFGKDDFQERYESFLELQNRYLASIEGHFHGKPDEIEDARKMYQDALLEICVRTERPLEAVTDQMGTLQLGSQPSWGDVKDSMGSFFKKIVGIETRSPVTQMWLDGHQFFEEYGYQVAQEHKIANIKGDHWKLKRLRSEIQETLKSDPLHSMEFPPLWMPPGMDLHKYLIFTEYRFLPDEVSSGLRYGVISDSKKFRGSHLGYFPLHLKSAKRRSDEQSEVQKSIHWIYFYPWISFEPGVDRRITKLEMDDLLEGSEDLMDAVFRIEERFCGKNAELVLRLHERRKWMRGIPSPEIKRGSRRDLHDIFLGRHRDGNFPGAMLAKSAMVFDRSSNSEHQILEVGNALLKLFASPEAQLLGKRWSRKRARTKRESVHLAFANWYSERFRLEDVLREYFFLMKENGMSAHDAFSEAASAMGLKRSSNGSRSARPFQDRKESAGILGEDDLSPKSLRNAFNSPFPPYVLVSTSVGQEGLDFHRYCDRIVHWSPPSSPSVMRQREGRVDRFRSLQNRKAMKGKFVSDPLGLSPDFVVLDENGNRLNKTQRFVMALPYSSQAARWKQCVQRLYYNDLLIGVPDPIAVEKRFEAVLRGLSSEERKRRLEEFKRLCISLRPAR